MNRERQVIAVGVILDQAGGKVLVSRRPDDVHLGGLWEFPGGKLEPDETCRNALGRELYEELGIIVVDARPLIEIKHDYQEELVSLDVWLVTHWQGEPAGREGQQIAWVESDNLDGLEFPEANQPIIRAIKLPDVYGITPDLPDYGRDFFMRLEKNLVQGLRLLQFRSKQLKRAELHTTLKDIFNLCSLYKCRLLVNGLQDDSVMNFADGIHLTSKELLECRTRPLEKEYLVAGSCHNQSELSQANRLNLDFAVLSPVYWTGSHQAAVPLGWEQYSRLLDGINIPVYALGGMHYSDIGRAQSCGGQGVAMLSRLWSD